MAGMSNNDFRNLVSKQEQIRLPPPPPPQGRPQGGVDMQGGNGGMMMGGGMMQQGGMGGGGGGRGEGGNLPWNNPQWQQQPPNGRPPPPYPGPPRMGGGTPGMGPPGMGPQGMGPPGMGPGRGNFMPGPPPGGRGGPPNFHPPPGGGGGNPNMRYGPPPPYGAMGPGRGGPPPPYPGVGGGGGHSGGPGGGQYPTHMMPPGMGGGGGMDKGRHLQVGPPYGPVSKGQMVWYRERDGAWVEAEVVGVDVTIDPPSYGVRINGSTRETERERLSVLRPPPEGDAPKEWAANPPTDRKPPPAPKPCLWAAFKDDDGAEYYHNSETGETTWERPPEMGPTPVAEEEATKGEEYALPEGVSRIKKIADTRWTEAILEDGSGVYFFDVESGETTWDVPTEVDRSKKAEAERRAEAERQKRAEAAAAKRERDEEERRKNQEIVQVAAQMVVPLMQQHHMGSAVPPYPPPGYPGGPGPFGLPGYGLPPPRMPPNGMVMPPAMPPGMLRGPPGMIAPPPGYVEALRVQQQEAEQKDKEKRAKEDAKKAKEDAKAREVAEKKDRDERLHKFKLLLLEKGVSPGGAWEKELPKFCFDSRYKDLIPEPSERRAAFESFNRSDVVRYKEEARKAAAERKATGLERAREAMKGCKDMTAESTFDQWWAAEGSELDGVGDLKGDKKLRTLFEELVEPMRAAARQRKEERREKERTAFVEALKGDASIVPESSWSKFKRKVERDMERVARRRAGKDVDEEQGEVEEGEAALCDLEAMGWEEREKEFRSYTKGLEEEARRGREGARREEDRHKSSGGSGSDDRKRRHQVGGASERGEERGKKRKGSAETFREMLKELVKDPGMEWEEAREGLRSDERYDMCADELSSRERERLCIEHTDGLRSDLIKRMREALDGCVALTFTSTYEEAWEAASAVDQRFKMLRTRDREKAFDKWLDAKIDVEKQALRASLMDIPEVILMLDPSDREAIPDEVLQLSQWGGMEKVGHARSEVLWGVHGELLSSKRGSRKALEGRMADSTKEGKRSKANLASYVDVPHNK